MPVVAVIGDAAAASIGQRRRASTIGSNDITTASLMLLAVLILTCALASTTVNSTDWYRQGSSATAAPLVASAPRQKGLWPSIAASRAAHHAGRT